MSASLNLLTGGMTGPAPSLGLLAAGLAFVPTPAAAPPAPGPAPTPGVATGAFRMWTDGLLPTPTGAMAMWTDGLLPFGGIVDVPPLVQVRFRQETTVRTAWRREVRCAS